MQSEKSCIKTINGNDYTENILVYNKGKCKKTAKWSALSSDSKQF